MPASETLPEGRRIGKEVVRMRGYRVIGVKDKNPVAPFLGGRALKEEKVGARAAGSIEHDKSGTRPLIKGRLKPPSHRSSSEMPPSQASLTYPQVSAVCVPYTHSSLLNWMELGF
jgi:hypothetical protein